MNIGLLPSDRVAWDSGIKDETSCNIIEVGEETIWEDSFLMSFALPGLAVFLIILVVCKCHEDSIVMCF